MREMQGKILFGMDFHFVAFVINDKGIRHHGGAVWRLFETWVA